MRKKITMLLASLFACVGVMKAEVTDLPQMSTDGDVKYYTIKNTRSGKYANYAGDDTKMTQVSTPALASLFYFTASDAEAAEGFTPVMIHNAATTNKLADFTSWTEAGNAWFLSVDAQNETAAGLHITKSAAVGAWNGQAGWNAFNAEGTSAITNYAAIDAGSVFVIEEAVAQIAQMVADYKTAAKTALDMLPVGGVAEAKAAIDALEANIDAFAAVDAIVNGVAQYVAFRNSDTKDGSVRVNAYLLANMTNVKGHGNKPFNHLTGIWSLKYSGEGSFYIYNVNQKVYLGSPNSNGTLTEAPSAAYTFEKIEDNKVEFKHGGQTLHLNNHDGSGTVNSGWFLSSYDSDDPASRWHVETDFAAYVADYKTSALAALDGWETLSVVFDAALIEAAKTAINAIATTDYATIAAIDAELKKVTDAVAAKMFTFQTTADDNHRDGVWVSANMSTGKAVGLHGEKNYNSIWSLRHAGGVAFYLYNELNSVYMGAPSGNCTLTETPTAAYTFEIIDAENSIVEMHVGGETLHASNHNDDKLMNYDGDEAASRWIISTIDVAADIQTLLDGLTEDDYADVPALGQYPTAAYEALVEARTSAKTVEEVETAIAAFKAAKNLPVFIIGNGNVKDYAKDKSIYDNNSGTLYFKATNVYDKTMWWALDMTETTVGVTEEVGIYNVGTGNGFWGASYIKVTETSEDDGAGIVDDNIFLFYTTGNDTPIHFQDADQKIVRYGSKEATSGSAAMFTYIGNTYDLNKLTDDFFAAANELAAINVPNFTFAAGVNNYDAAAKPALDAAVANRTTVLSTLSSTAEEIAAAKAQLEEAIDGVQINMPVNGKFYRVRCAGNGMKYLQSTLDSSNESDVRLQVLSGATSVNATFCYVDGALLSYTTGLYINAYRFNEVGAKSDVVFSEASNGKVGAYNITVGGRYIFGAQDNNKIDSGSGTPDNRDGYTWWLEEVTELPVVVSAAGFATLYAPVALTIADGVTAYTAVVEGETLVLNEVEGTIPANTGVILEADPETYNFAVAADVAAIEGNALEGSYAKSVKNAEAKVYTLQKPAEKEAGFYLFKGYTDEADQEGTKTYINGFRAWIEVAADKEAPAMFTLGRGGEDEDATAIDQLLNANGELVIYDLSGRRVEKMEKGIYIVNGKKVVK